MPEDAPREFVIPVRGRWKLWILPVLALLYFAFVLTLAALDLGVRGVPDEMLALVGVGLFVLVLLVELPFLLKRRPRKAPEETEEETPYAPPAAADAYARPLEPAPRRVADDEYKTTPEEKQGLRVLEYSVPAKATHPGAVYAKAYVPVSKEHVLRVETLGADTHEL